MVVGSQLKVHVSNHSASAEVEIPGDIFSSKMSFDDILNKLSAFSVTIKDVNGNVISVGDGLYVTNIQYNGTSVTSGTLPKGAVIEVTTVSGKIRIPDDFAPIGMWRSDVIAALRTMGFAEPEVKFEVNSDYDDGHVFRVECSGNEVAAGDLIDANATIVIFIAGTA